MIFIQKLIWKYLISQKQLYVLVIVQSIHKDRGLPLRLCLGWTDTPICMVATNMFSLISMSIWLYTRLICGSVQYLYYSNRFCPLTPPGLLAPLLFCLAPWATQAHWMSQSTPPNSSLPLVNLPSLRSTSCHPPTPRCCRTIPSWSPRHGHLRRRCSPQRREEGGCCIDPAPSPPGA